MRKSVFLLLGIGLATMVWGQAVVDPSVLGQNQAPVSGIIGAPIAEIAQAAPTSATPAAPASQDQVANHLDARNQAANQLEQNPDFFKDNSPEGIQKRVQFLEYLHGLTGPAPVIKGVKGFIPARYGESDVVIIGYSGDIKNNLVIPEAITEGKIQGTVVGIGPGALSNLQLSGSITIADTVKFIGVEAFANNDLTSVKFPSSPDFKDVTDDSGNITQPAIGNGAFSNNKLTNVTIPDTVTEIEYNTFSGNRISSISIPNTITKIGHHAFSNNVITNLTLPNSVTSIDNSAFENNKLSRLTLTNYITHLGDNAFAVNQLKEVTIPTLAKDKAAPADGTEPECLTKLQYGVFSHNQITKVTFATYDDPSTTDVTEKTIYISEIGDNAFSDNLLPTITIPQSVTLIGKGAFSVNKLKEVLFVGDIKTQEVSALVQTQGANVKTIGEGAFAYNLLPTISIPDSVTNINSLAFYDNQLTRIVLGEGLQFIGSQAFYRNKLSSVTIPNSVIAIDDGAFLGGKTSSQASNQNQLVSVTIGRSVRYIGNQAFANNQLTNAVIPNGVYFIGSKAFENNRLSSITLGRIENSGKSKEGFLQAKGGGETSDLIYDIDNKNPIKGLTIETDAFNQNALTSLVIPDTCVKVGTGAFTSNNIRNSVIIPLELSTSTDMGRTSTTIMGNIQNAFDEQTQSRLIFL